MREEEITVRMLIIRPASGKVGIRRMCSGVPTSIFCNRAKKAPEREKGTWKPVFFFFTRTYEQLYSSTESRQCFDNGRILWS